MLYQNIYRMFQNHMHLSHKSSKTTHKNHENYKKQDKRNLFKRKETKKTQFYFYKKIMHIVINEIASESKFELRC